MDENDIKIGIENTVAQSPVTTQKQASKNIEAPDGQSTFVTGDLEGNVADQTVTTPDRGIAFTKDTTEVYTGGTALPNLNYDTRRQTPADRGNPLYFEPNYQPVVPFNVQTPYGNVASTTLDPEKLAWQIAVSVAGRGDDGYIGYKEMPTAGTLGWGSHWLGAAKQFTYNLIPEMGKGGASLAAGAPAAAFRGMNSIEKDYLADMYGMEFDDGEERKPSAIAASMRARGFTPSEEDKQEHLARLEEGSFWADGYQYVQDQVDASMNWAENHYGNTLVADALDNSGKAQTAAGVASGMVNFGAALLAHDPKGVFTLLNFASQSQMRKNALDAGVSPAWATAYSFGGAGVNSLLDMFQFEAITGGFALTRKAVYQQIAKEGVYKFHLAKALGRNALDMFVVEPTTEMVQEAIEGSYDPDFLAHPDDRLVVAAISAMAVKAAGLPSAVRHARAEERLAVAKALGVDTAYLSIVKEARDTLNNWVKQGKFDADKVDQTMEMIISRAPDAIAKEIRDGVLGQFNKVSMKERSEFADALTNVNPNSISMQQFNKLDTRVDDALKEIALPDSQKTMIKGVVRGLAQLKLLQDGTAPSEINVPSFVLTTRGDSGYDAETNTITISLGFSGTTFSKTRANANARDDENFNNYLRAGFIPSSRQSDRMSSVLHELAHWIDYQIGETGFGDFLEAYYNNIAEVFGNDRALSVYKRTKKGADRFGRTGDKYTSTRNASEWNAQAVGRLGKRVAEQFGLSKSKAQRFLSYANMVFNQVATWTDPKQLKESAKIFGDFQTAMQDVAKENMDTIKDLVDVFGEDGIKAAVKDFLSGAGNPNEDLVEYLARNDMLRQLFNVMDSFADNVGLEQIGKLFDSKEEMRSFVEQGDIYFNSGYDDAVAEVQERRKQLQERRAKKEGTTPQTTTASNNMRQVALSNGTVVSVPKNVKPLGNDQITEDDLNGKKTTQNEFVGMHAQLPIIQQLTQAKEMMEQKVDEQKIFKETGWFFDGKDKRWKYDIGFGEFKYQPTSVNYFGGKPESRMMFLNEVYDNKKLYDAYPLLKNTWMVLTPNEKVTEGDAHTTYDEKTKTFRIELTYNPNDLEKTFNATLLHEIQHTVQDIENFARGGSVYEFISKAQLKYIYDTKGEEAAKKALDEAFDKYESLGGEIEANNVRERYLNRNMLQGLGNPEGVLPKYTQRIPDSKAIVRFSDLDIPVAEPEAEKTIQNEKTEQFEHLPNDYVNDEDPTEEVRLAYENGKQADVDEKPSYDLEVDGRKVGEDIASMTKGIMKRAKNLPNKIVKWAASSPFGWGIDRIMITMFGRDVAEQFDVQGKYAARNTIRSQAYTRFMKKLEPIIGNIETDKTAAMFKYKTMLNQLGFVRVSGVELNNPVVPDLATKKDLTGWEVMYVYLMKRMGPKFANRIQQKTHTNINELISTLTEEEKQFANAMSDTLREIWIERVGRERAMWNYFPIMDDEHSFFDETSIDNFRQRMETDKPIAIEDAGRLFSKEISRLASWDSGYYRTLKRLRDVLQYKGANGRNIDPDVDGELKKASGILAGQIKDIFGVDGYHNLLRLLDMQIADPQEQMLDSAASKTMQQMGNNIIRGLLSFKFLSLPKNLANITMMWGGAKDQATYWNGFAEGISDLAGTWKYMMKNSEQIRERYDNIGYNEFLDQRNTGGSTAPVFKGASKVFAKMDWTGDKTGGMAKMSAVLDMLGEAGLKMFMLNGDAVANIYGGYGLIKDYMAQGLSEAQAFKKLDRYIVEHQSSSNMAMKPLRQLEANKSLAGQLMAFTSEGVVKGASILGTFDEVKMGTATKSEAIANALSIAASMALFALIGAGAWDLWDDDEKVRDEAVKALEGALVDQVFGFSVLGNGFITPMVQNLLGLGGQSGISAPIWSVATEGIGNLKRGEYDRIITKALEASGLLVGANAIYNDLLGMMMVNSDDPDVRDAGFRMLMGHTIGYAEKRTGTELRNSSKENVENEDEE